MSTPLVHANTAAFKRKIDETIMNNRAQPDHSDDDDDASSSIFRATATATEAQSLTDCVTLSSPGVETNGHVSPVLLPWVGYGSYKLGKQVARSCTLEALKCGYRAIDTAFIYGGETTEVQVGLAIQDALAAGRRQDDNQEEDEQPLPVLERREDLVVVSKHWRKYHGYAETQQCLRLSLKRLQLDYIDLWLMHWPGPAWSTMSRRKDDIAKYGPWHYAIHSKEDMPHLRAETWRAMEDAVAAGKVRAIGVANFSIQHLERLKQTATKWPPAVNQIECHPLFPQTELVKYCQKEGIVVQAYSSLGSQDAGKKFWRQLFPPSKAAPLAVTKLLDTPPALKLAAECHRTPAQVFLRWALQKNLCVVPKTASPERMTENAKIFDFSLSSDQMDRLEKQLQDALVQAAKREGCKDVQSMARLCWRNDPLRDLQFD